MSKFTEVGPDVFCFRDTCRVYVVRRGKRALAVDFGRGAVLDHLSEIGVEALDWILHTHHHRAVCLGDVKAVATGTKIAVPAAEATLFEDVETHWKKWAIYVNYDLRNRYDCLRASVPVARKLERGETLEWEGISFEAMATPGHTDGSLSYVAQIGGETLCFCGEAISSPGKISTFHDLHWGYMGFDQGARALSEALGRVLESKPTKLLPAGGEPMEDPEGAIEPLRERLDRVAAHLKSNHGGRKNHQLHQVAERIWFLGCTTYCIIAESGHALLWDYGYVERGAVATLRKEHGLKQIDIVAVSHYHDDHVCRIPELVHTVCRNQSPRPKVWVFENQAELYSDPTRFNIPCLWPTPIPFERVLTDGEVVEWEGIRLEFFFMPGQTEWHCGMIADIDGKRYAFTGDNLWKPGDADRAPNGPIIWRNQQFLDGGTHLGFKKLREYKPDVILPAHTDPVEPVTPEYLDALVAWSSQIKPMMADLIDQPDPEFGCDCFWVHFFPYRRVLRPGTREFVAGAVVRNHQDQDAELRVQPALPEGWAAEPRAVETTLAAKSEHTFPFRVRAPNLKSGERHVLAAEIRMAGVDHGEMAEMIIDVSDNA